MTIASTTASSCPCQGMDGHQETATAKADGKSHPFLELAKIYKSAPGVSTSDALTTAAEDRPDLLLDFTLGKMISARARGMTTSGAIADAVNAIDRATARTAMLNETVCALRDPATLSERALFGLSLTLEGLRQDLDDARAAIRKRA